MGDRLRHLLYLAYYFPPLGGAGVQRVVKFCKYLPEFGFEPVVVTGPADRRAHYAPLDASLVCETEDLEVLRVPGPFPDETQGARWARLLVQPSRFETAWCRGCEAVALGAAERHRFAVILASMSPFETADVAARLARRLCIPWVADLRDPWALDEMIPHPTGWHRARALRRMRHSLSSAALVIMNTPEAAKALRESFPELAGRTLALTNGFDADDFINAATDPHPGLFRIVHTGSLHVSGGQAHRRMQPIRRLAGGEPVAIDILTRSHWFLLRAMERWRAQAEAEVAKVELVLAGDLSHQDRLAVERSRVSDRVQMPGYVSHAESVALLQGADLLFLPMHKMPAGERARIVPGKTYEYLAARRPILAAVPEGDARDLILASGAGDVCAPDDERCMVEIMRRRFQAWRGSEPIAAAPDDFLRPFERRQITAQLSQALLSTLQSDSIRGGNEGSGVRGGRD